MISFTCPSCARRLRAPDDFRGKKVSCNHCAAIFWAGPPLAPVSIQAKAPLAPVQIVPSRRWPRRWLVAGVCAVPLVLAGLLSTFMWLQYWQVLAQHPSVLASSQSEPAPAPRALELLQQQYPTALTSAQVLAEPDRWLGRTVLVRSLVAADSLGWGYIDRSTGRRFFNMYVTDDLDPMKPNAWRNPDAWLCCSFYLDRSSQGTVLAGYEVHRQVHYEDQVVMRGRLVRKRYAYPRPNSEYFVSLEDCEVVHLQHP
jgi:hypothetical protein